MKDAEYFRRLFGEDWHKRQQGTGMLEGVFPVTLSYNLKGNTMRIAFSGMVLKTLSGVVVWDTRNRKRKAEQDLEKATPKKIHPIFETEILE